MALLCRAPQALTLRSLAVLITALLGACALLAPSVAAEPAYTPETLAALLPSQSVLEAATGLTFVATQDLRPGSDPVTAGRAFAVGNGSFVSVNLFSRADGAPPDAALRRSLRDGAFLREALASTFVVDNYAALPALSREGDDVAVSFLSIVRGETFSVIASAFHRGYIYGIVIHATATANNPSVARATLALVSGGLPH